MLRLILFFLFFFNDTATTEIYTLSLHDALPIWIGARAQLQHCDGLDALRACGAERDAGGDKRWNERLHTAPPGRNGHWHRSAPAGSAKQVSSYPLSAARRPISSSEMAPKRASSADRAVSCRQIGRAHV